MAKRFTDSAKWDKVWFRKLKPVHKCLWIYICDRCDHAGIWEVDLETASYFIGEKLTIEEILVAFEKQFIELNSGSKWLIKDFLIFQYGNFDESNKMFKPIQSSLNKNGVSMEDIWGINPLKVKDKVMVKVKEVVKPTIEEISAYCIERKNSVDPEKFFAYYEANGWRQSSGNPIKKWQMAVITWEKTSFDKGVKAPHDNTPRKAADQDCTNCRGTGQVYAPGSGKYSPCFCTKIN